MKDPNTKDIPDIIGYCKNNLLLTNYDEAAEISRESWESLKSTDVGMMKNFDVSMLMARARLSQYIVRRKRIKLQYDGKKRQDLMKLATDTLLEDLRKIFADNA